MPMSLSSLPSKIAAGPGDDSDAKRQRVCSEDQARLLMIIQKAAKSNPILISSSSHGTAGATTVANAAVAGALKQRPSMSAPSAEVKGASAGVVPLVGAVAGAVLGGGSSGKKMVQSKLFFPRVVSSQSVTPVDAVKKLVTCETTPVVACDEPTAAAPPLAGEAAILVD